MLHTPRKPVYMGVLTAHDTYETYIAALYHISAHTWGMGHCHGMGQHSQRHMAYSVIAFLCSL